MNLQQMAASVAAPKTTVIDNSSRVKTRNSIAGGFCGYLGACFVSSLSGDVADYAASLKNNINSELLGKDNCEKIVNIADKYVEEKLAKNGVSVLKFSKAAPAEEKLAMYAVLSENYNSLSKWLTKLAVKHNKPYLHKAAVWATYLTKSVDSSAMYLNKTKTLLIPGEKAEADAFAALAEASRKFPALQALKGPLCRGIKLLTLPILITAVCSRNKTAKQGEELSKKDKFTNFVRQNAGKLSMLAALPVFLSGVNTSIKAANIARKYASKEIAQSVYAHEGLQTVKNALLIGIAGMSVSCGVEIKDWFQKQKDKKLLRPAQADSAKITNSK